MAENVSTENLQNYRRLRTIVNVPSVVCVFGLILFFMFLILFGNDVGIHVLQGKRYMPVFLEFFGWVFLFGTVVNLLVYPVIWLLLYVFKEPIAAKPRNFLIVWLLSGGAIFFFYRYIEWFMD